MALLSYIVGSGLTALISGVSYKYFSYKKDIEELEESTDLNGSINYSLIDEKLKETMVSSKKSPSLGVTFQDKCTSIIKICREDCGFDCRNNGKKDRQKLLRYIREYEKIGKIGFVTNHKKKYKRD
jgi:hypothetical protein